jgi:ATP-dependent RNA helicase DDX6/DHH1
MSLTRYTKNWKENIKPTGPDTRRKTEDVTSRKGNTWEDFFLKREVLMGLYEMGFESPSPI